MSLLNALEKSFKCNDLRDKMFEFSSELIKLQEKMKIKFIKDTIGIYGREFKKGFVKEYFPWNSEWQGTKEQERVDNGIFVECLGHGEFNVFTKNDVIVQKD